MFKRLDRRYDPGTMPSNAADMLPPEASTDLAGGHLLGSDARIDLPMTGEKLLGGRNGRQMADADRPDPTMPFNIAERERRLRRIIASAA